MFANSSSMNDEEDSFTPVHLLIVCAFLCSIGVVMNAFCLWTWFSVRKTYFPTVFWLKVLASVHVVFLSTYILAYFHFTNEKDYVQFIFRIVSYGFRNMSVYTTMMLAVVQYTRMFYPVNADKLLSEFRMKMTMGALCLLCLCVEIGPTVRCFNDGQIDLDNSYGEFTLENGIGVVAPSTFQIFLVASVVVNYWRLSKIAEYESVFVRLPPSVAATHELVDIVGLPELALKTRQPRLQSVGSGVKLEQAHAATTNSETAHTSGATPRQPEATLPARAQQTSPPPVTGPKHPGLRNTITKRQSSKTNFRRKSQPLFYMRMYGTHFNRLSVWVIPAICFSTFLTYAFFELLVNLLSSDDDLTSKIGTIVSALNCSVTISFCLCIPHFRMAFVNRFVKCRKTPYRPSKGKPEPEQEINMETTSKGDKDKSEK